MFRHLCGLILISSDPLSFLAFVVVVGLFLFCLFFLSSPQTMFALGSLEFHKVWAKPKPNLLIGKY